METKTVGNGSFILDDNYVYLNVEKYIETGILENIIDPYVDNEFATEDTQFDLSAIGSSPNVAMKLRLMTDSIIDANKLRPVTNPIFFDSGFRPSIDGLFSEYIFGTTAEERSKNYGFIDLREKFFHPYIYEILCRLNSSIEKCANGQIYCRVNSNGDMEVCKEDDEGAGTGLGWLVNNIKTIKFKETNSLIRDDRLKMIESLSPEEMFISKFLVIPVIYRDVSKTNDTPQIPELNNIYAKIIRYVKYLKGYETIEFVRNNTRISIQNTLVEVRKYFQSLLEKKNGFIHKNVLGKNVDYGFRMVISTPILTPAQKPEDMQVNVTKTGVPIAYAAMGLYPFVMKWLSDFFRREFANGEMIPVHGWRLDANGNKKLAVVFAEGDNVLSYYNADNLRKYIERYKNTVSSRLDYVLVPIKEKYIPKVKEINADLYNGNYIRIKFKGMGRIDHWNEPIDRYITWTDLLYQATYDAAENKHLYVTRYPLEDHFGTFPSKIEILSTIETMPINIDGTIYPFYPKITNDDLNNPENAPSKFYETMCISNLYLEGIGGDYDGDMVTAKACFSQEANQEAAEIMNSTKHFVTVNGTMNKILKNEQYLGLYNMTRYE